MPIQRRRIISQRRTVMFGTPMQRTRSSMDMRRRHAMLARAKGKASANAIQENNSASKKDIKQTVIIARTANIMSPVHNQNNGKTNMASHGRGGIQNSQGRSLSASVSRRTRVSPVRKSAAQRAVASRRHPSTGSRGQQHRSSNLRQPHVSSNRISNTRSRKFMPRSRVAAGPGFAHVKSGSDHVIAGRNQLSHGSHGSNVNGGHDHLLHGSNVNAGNTGRTLDSQSFDQLLLSLQNAGSGANTNSFGGADMNSRSESILLNELMKEISNSANPSQNALPQLSNANSIDTALVLEALIGNNAALNGVLGQSIQDLGSNIGQGQQRNTGQNQLGGFGNAGQNHIGAFRNTGNTGSGTTMNFLDSLFGVQTTISPLMNNNVRNNNVINNNVVGGMSFNTIPSRNTGTRHNSSPISAQSNRNSQFSSRGLQGQGQVQGQQHMVIEAGSNLNVAFKMNKNGQPTITIENRKATKAGAVTKNKGMTRKAGGEIENVQ